MLKFNHTPKSGVPSFTDSVILTNYESATLNAKLNYYLFMPAVLKTKVILHGTTLLHNSFEVETQLTLEFINHSTSLVKRN